MNDDATNNDLITNPSPRCPCILVLDTSGSMNGEPISELNEGVQAFLEEVRDDEIASYSVEIGIISVGGVAQVQMPLTPMYLVDSIRRFPAGGGTPLGSAVDMALNMLDNRKKECKTIGVTYYQPWMVIISDGIPTDSWEAAASRSKHLAEKRKLAVMPVGVAGADLDILSKFSNRPAKRLGGLKFKELFLWLSASMSRVSSSASTSATVTLPPTDGWESL